MPEPLTISAVAVAALTGLAADFLKNIAKGVKGLFEPNETKTFFNEAFLQFKEDCFRQGEQRTGDEQKLLNVFQEFFSSQRTIKQLELVPEGETRIWSNTLKKPPQQPLAVYRHPSPPGKRRNPPPLRIRDEACTGERARRPLQPNHEGTGTTTERRRIRRGDQRKIRWGDQRKIRWGGTATRRVGRVLSVRTVGVSKSLPICYNFSMENKREMRVKVFSSFEEENRAEYRRRARMTPMERLEEFGKLQERAWGKKWTEEPMVKVATFEKLPWYKEP